MTIGRDLHMIDLSEMKKWAASKDLEPGIVKGTRDAIQFVARGGSDKVDPTDWETFEEILKRKKLAVYATDEGWMKIMRKR